MRTAVLFVLISVATASAGSGTDELTAKEITAGRKVYVAKCAKCHKFYEPKSYSEADWGRWMESMSRKSKLKTDQDKLLRRYLDEYRAGRIPKVK
jgi:cytochrome c5